MGILFSFRYHAAPRVHESASFPPIVSSAYSSLPHHVSPPSFFPPLFSSFPLKAMAKVEPKKLPRTTLRALERELRDVFLRPRRREELADLIFDLLTPSERVMTARRIQVAKRLIAGKSSLEIKAELHVGFPMIQNVDRWLESNLESYRRVIPPLLQEKREKGMRTGKKDIGAPFTFKRLRRTYPDKFMLINMLLDE